jgi:hypothetical protein
MAQREETFMKQPGLDNRHRDKNGEIAKKHGNTLISTLREKYGKDFAPGMVEDKMLKDALQELDERSLSKLLADRKK